jgi:60 kDa SS-A/Ro ribonucleoprotein
VKEVVTMANKALFRTASRGRQAPPADTKNAAGGMAYSFTAEHQLAQLASTGTFNDTFYEKGKDQLDALRHAADKVSPEFIAKCAVYAREKAFMKDMPAALAVVLSKADPVLLDKIFGRVVDNGKQLRNFVQFIRSGAFGRKSLGSGPKRLIKRWFASRSDWALFRASVGNDPSLADIVKLARPKPSDVMKPLREKDKTVEEIQAAVLARCAFYARLIGKPHEFEALPEIVQHYERFKKGDRSLGVPKVDFRMLTSLPLTKEDWTEIARNGRWHQTRMNLNTYARHGVLEDQALVRVLADRLRDPEEIGKARAFPYQLLAAYLNTGPDRTQNFGYFYSRRQPQVEQKTEVPQPLRLALQDAMEEATKNVPAFEGRVAVIVDTSGSMGQSVTGYRQGATSKVRCVDVAALVGATVMRKNPLAVLIPVDTQVHDARGINPRDSIMTNAEKLARFGGGGTRLGAAMQFVETAKAAPDLIIMVSDNESWVGDAQRPTYHGTETMAVFNRLKARNPGLKMVNIDIVANSTSQTPCKGEPSILNIGGFSDTIWDTIARFVSQEGPERWVQEINEISLDAPVEA